MTKWLILCASLALTACGANRGSDSFKTVAANLPVAVSCVPADFSPPPARPATKESLLSAPDAAERHRQLAEYFTVEDPRLDLDESVISACRSAGAAK